MSHDPIVVGVGAVVVRDGRLLVIKRGNAPARGLWSVPGGRLEHGELLADAAVRELREETGLDGRAQGLCGIAERISDEGHVVIHDYWIEVDGQAAPVAGDDAAAVTFVSRTELLALPLVPGFVSFLTEHGVWERMAP